MKDIKIEPIFADFFVEDELNIDHEQIVKYIKKQKSEGPSIYFNGNEPQLGQFYGTVRTMVDALHTKLGLYSKLKQQMYMAWANIETNEYITVPHTHSERAYAAISGVYYPQAPEGSYPIGFMSNNVSVKHVMLDGIVEEPNCYNVGMTERYPTTGKIYIFPSWLTHYVIRKEKAYEGERISLAFNCEMIPID